MTSPDTASTNDVPAYRRVFDGVAKALGATTGAVFIYAAVTGNLTTFQLTGLLLMASLLMYVARCWAADDSIVRKVLGTAAALPGVVATQHFMSQEQELILRAGRATQTDITMGVVLIASLVILVWLTNGWMLAAIPVAALAYGFWGHLLPGAFQHAPLTWEFLVAELTLQTSGVWGVALKAVALYVVMFMLMGGFLQASGASEAIIDASNALFGRVRGGAAKVAVVASGGLGSLSGTAVANVVGSGSFTIPLMKRLGFRPAVAGGIEAVASTGGYLMPPVMGSAAFIMAEYLGTSYTAVIAAAAIPAVLFYFAVYRMVDLEAAKLGIGAIPRDQLPRLITVLRTSGYLFLPLGVLIVLLGFLQYSPRTSALWTVAAIVAVSFLKWKNRIRLRAAIEAVHGSMQALVQIVIAVAAIGIVIGVLNTTGLGLTLAIIIRDFAGGSLLVLLVACALSSIVLGMALPAVVSYILLAVVLAPAIIDAGVEPMAAHLFVLYFGALSNVTPPVALAAYAAAPIAGARPLQIAWHGTRLGVAAYLLPFAFVYGPELVLIGEPGGILVATLTALLGVTYLACAVQGHAVISLQIWERAGLAAAALSLVFSGTVTDIAGALVGGVIIARNYYLARRSKPVAA